LAERRQVPDKYYTLVSFYRLEVGWQKVACWSTKAAIYETRKDRVKVTIEDL